jgi:hypothetical protein
MCVLICLVKFFFKKFFFFNFFWFIRYYIPLFINFFCYKNIFLLILLNISLLIFSLNLLLKYVFKQQNLLYYFFITYKTSHQYLFYARVLVYYIAFNFFVLYLYNYFFFLTRFYIFISKQWFHGIICILLFVFRKKIL